MAARIAKVTSKGQVTIPKPIREALGIEEHDRLLFTVEGGRLVGMPVSRRSLKELYASLPPSRPFPGHGEIREELARKLGEKMARGDK